MFSGTIQKISEIKPNPNLQGAKRKFKFGGTFPILPSLGNRFTFYSSEIAQGGLSTSFVGEFIYEEDNESDYLFRTESGTIYRLSAVRSIDETTINSMLF